MAGKEKEKVWDVCPDCRGTAWTIRHQELGPWSMEQECLGCGRIGEDLHFTADPEPEPVAKVVGRQPDTFPAERKKG